MATLVVFSGTGDGAILSQDATYSLARAGTGGTLTAATAATTIRVGQSLTHRCDEAFVAFDTSALGAAATVSAAALATWLVTDSSAVDFQCRARDYAFGTLTTADWVPGASLASTGSLRATLDTSGIGSTGAYKTWSDVAMVAAVDTTGTTELVLYSSRTEGNLAPAGTNEFVVFSAADAGGTTNDPKLTITYTASVPVDVALTPVALALGPVAPGVAAQAGVEPAPLALALGPVAPQVGVSATASPAPVAVALGPVAPTVTGTAAAAPGPVAVALGPVAPGVAAQAGVALAPVTLALGPVAPTVGLVLSVPVTPVALALAPVAPLVAARASVAPAAVVLALGPVAPVVAAGAGVTPAPVILRLGPVAMAWVGGVGAALAGAAQGRGAGAARLYAVGAGMPVEVEIYDAGFSPPRLIALLDGAREVSWFDPLNELGSFTFRIPRADPKAGERVIAPGNLVRLRLHGVARFAGWVDQAAQVIASTSGASGEWLKVAGPSAEAYLGRARLAFEGADGDGNRVATGYIAAILRDLIAEASTATRPTLALMAVDYTAAEDTAGAPWDDAATYAFPWGSTTVLDVWRAAVGMGIDFRMTPALALQAYEAGLGSDLSPWVQFRHLRADLELPHDEGQFLNVVWVKGSEGAIQTVYGNHADPRRGRREGLVDFGATNEPAALIRAGNAAMAAAEAAAGALHLPVHHGRAGGLFEPYLDFQKGDTVGLDIPGLARSTRIAAITITATEGGDYTVDLDGGAVRLDNLVRLKRLIEGRASPLLSVATL